MICFGTHNDHLMSFHVNASLISFQSLMNKSPRLWALQLLPLLKLKVVVACNRFGGCRSNVCLFSFVPNLLFSVLSDSFISPAACSKHSQPDLSLLLLAGTVAPPEMILPGGCLPRQNNQTSWSWHLQLQLAVLRKYTDSTNLVLIKAQIFMFHPDSSGAASHK